MQPFITGNTAAGTSKHGAATARGDAAAPLANLMTILFQAAALFAHAAFLLVRLPQRHMNRGIVQETGRIVLPLAHTQVSLFTALFSSRF